MRSFLTRLWRLFRPPSLEDGEVVSADDGIYRRCPECKQLVPQVVDTPFGEMQPLFDLRHCITGEVNTGAKTSRLHRQCRVCGLSLKDSDGNHLFI